MSCSGTCHNHINFVSKGKLLLIDVEKAKRDEFNRRRKIRLQQVRNQSNEIAKEIRDKVKAEKLLKDSKEELKKQTHFNKWKDAQHKSLQDEFNRRAAIQEQDKENALKEDELAKLERERQKVLEEIAKKRGNLAVLKQRKEKLNDETENFVKTSNAKFNRSLENLRSALVSSLPKPDLSKPCPSSKVSSDKTSSADSALPNESVNDDVQDYNSEMRVISSDNTTHPCGGCYISSVAGPSGKKTSPGRLGHSKINFTTKQNSNISKNHGTGKIEIRTSSTKPSIPSIQSDQSFSSVGDYRNKHTVIKSQSACQISPKKYSEKKIDSPSKRLASNVLMSPSKRVNKSSRCNHSLDTSPVRCEESYTPNKFRDSLDFGQQETSNHQSRRVRFENISSPEESIYRSSCVRSRTVSENDSDISYESDITWPPRDWNRNQDEEVILYDHCARSTTKYQPKHTVSLISDQTNYVDLEEEIVACRERALKKHEESLRERRGCRAMYRQRLRAEFSCMLADLAKLDKTTRLAKLESEAKAALLPKKQKKKPDSSNQKNNDKLGADDKDIPGNVRLMECIDSLDKNNDVEVTRQELMDCNLNALDQLLVRLQKQRDHLLDCHSNLEQAEKEDKTVQCITRESVDSATSPRKLSPTRDVPTVEAHYGKASRATSPIKMDINYDPITAAPQSFNENEKNKSSQSFQSSPSFTSGTLSSTPKKDKLENHLQSSIPNDGVPSSFKSLGSPANDSKHISSMQLSDENNSSSTVNASAYSLEGVKVEVKVTKNKVKKLEKKVKSKDPLKKIKDTHVPFSEISVDQSWAKKLSNSSSGTSYLSPPEELNPDEHKLLISVLEGMDKRNKNPALGIYIQKLLSMSKCSLENMSISVSDDSIRSETFQSCNEESGEVYKVPRYSQSSYVTAQSETETRVQEQRATNGMPVKKIFESDDSSFNNNKEKIEQECVVPSREEKIDKSRYITALKNYNDRLRQLAESIAVKEPSLNKSENDTSYLEVPNSVHDSFKIEEPIDQIGLPRPEASFVSENRHFFPSTSERSSSWNVSLNIYPKPDSIGPPERRPKPPSTINKYTSRGVVQEDEVLIDHELSTINEVDSKLMITLQPSKSHQSLFINKNTKQIPPNLAEQVSEESFHTLPPTGATLPSDTSFASSSPVKLADESSLQIFTELPDSSFGQSSNEEVAVSEVFKSLGIGWALSTWRKTHEASKKNHESSSSSSDPTTVNKKKSDELLCRHSTPIKMSDVEKNLKSLEDDSDKLTPPSLNLYQRYQNLIRSISEVSSNSTES